MIAEVRDSGTVDTAVINLLDGDPVLSALLGGGGVFSDRAPQGQTKFVIVSVIEHLDVYAYRDAAFETFWIMVKAVTSTTDRAVTKAAARRIHALLQNGDALIVPGCRVMDCKRERFIDGTEYDERAQRFWQHVGGLYIVEVTTAEGGA